MNTSISNIPMVIDGSNFINRVLDMGIDSDLISKQLTFSGLREFVNRKLKQEGIMDQCEVIEFICSKKLFGSGSKRFSQSDRDFMIQRLMTETGVHIEEVNIPGSSEKGVDMTVSTKIETFSEQLSSIILISEDRDFIPLLHRMRNKGKKIILVSLKKPFPIDLINEAFLSINLQDDYGYLFNYSYPSFYLEDDFTIENYREMLSNADDRNNNQIRVDFDGQVYISHEHVGSADISGVKFRFETFAAYNGYVGPKAASDQDFVKRGFTNIKSAWESGKKGYIDYMGW